MTGRRGVRKCMPLCRRTKSHSPARGFPGPSQRYGAETVPGVGYDVIQEFSGVLQYTVVAALRQARLEFKGEPRLGIPERVKRCQVPFRREMVIGVVDRDPRRGYARAPWEGPSASPLVATSTTSSTGRTAG